MLFITIPAFLFPDRWGRSTSAIVGGATQVVCMFVMGSLYAAGAVHGDRGAARWVVIVMIYIFAIIFSATWAVCFRVYVSEIQSPETRAGASSLALSANWLVNWIIAFTTPIFLARSTYGVYFLFGSSALVVVVVCAFSMPETRNKTLEDIDAIFRGQKGGVSGGGWVFELQSMNTPRVEHSVDEVPFTTSMKT